MSAFGEPFDDSVSLPQFDGNRLEMEETEVPRVVAEVASSPPTSRKRLYTTVAVLFVVNLLNYMDRFTIAGVLIQIQKHFEIENNDTLAGLIQTSFIVFYMLLSPVFGYLGDRYSRKLLMTVGIIFWCCVTLAGSFVPPGRQYYLLFLFLRAMVGVGEASYSTIAPTMIADLCVHDLRTKMLMFFYFAIPVGSGMGYIVGAKVAEAFGGWEWSLRVTPALGVICVIAIIFLIQDPVRGEAEGHTGLVNTPLKADLVYLVKNRSFVLSTLAFTGVAFVAGALSLWAPKTIKYAYSVAEGVDEETQKVAFIFGAITVATGFGGVFLGAESARRYKKINARADPLICGLGMLLSGPLLYLGLVFARYNIYVTYVFIFFGELFLFINWPLIADILLYVVIPTRRSTAEAAQILFSHAFGDAGSPFLIGVISDSIRGDAGGPANEFAALQQSLFCCAFVCVISGGLFLVTALFVEEDRKKADILASRGADGASLNDDYSDDETLVRQEVYT